MRGVERGDRNQNISAWSNERGGNLEIAISGGGPGPAGQKGYTSGREEEEEYAQDCPWGKTI